MFQKIVAIEPVNLLPAAKERLHEFAKEVVLYDSLPADDEEIIRRVGDADAALISYTTRMGRKAVTGCPNLRYIGMCCSLYEEKSANVDIAAAREKGIVVTGVKDYGDEGVVEYVISELVRYLHGFGSKQWRADPMEITGLKAGVIGMGATGTMIAAGLQYFGADVRYFSRTRKPALEEAHGYRWMELSELLADCDAIFTCLTKNVILMKDEQFAQFGDGKIFFNTSIAPSFETEALERWLARGGNELFCDMPSALGEHAERLLANPHVNCIGQSAGFTGQAAVRLSEKSLNNIRAFLENN